MSKITKLKKRLRRSVKMRQHWEAPYQDVYDFCLPGKQDFFARTATDDAPEIFDHTAVIGIQEFASRMQAGLVPNYAKWVQLEAGSIIEDPTQRAQANEQLEGITEKIFEYLHNSNFGQEAHEFFIDIAVGTAAMEVLEGDALEPLIFNAVPLNELTIDTAYNDQVSGFWRQRKKAIGDIERQYDVKIPEDVKRKLVQNDTSGKDADDCEVKICVCVYRDWEKENEFAYKRYVFLPDCEDDSAILREDNLSGQGSNPFVGARWSKVSGEAWGRGPAYNMLPSIRVLNLVTQLTLENAEMEIVGMMTYEDDGILNPDNISIRSGELIPIAPGSRGLNRIGGSSNFNVGDLIISRLQQEVKKGLYNDTLGPTDKTPMSATEVQQRMADLARQIGSAFGRLQVEFVNAIIQRVIYILKKKGIIELPVIDGREIKIVATSPLAQAQAFEEINGVTSWLGVIAQYYGERGLELYSDGSEVAKYTQTRFNVPQRLYRDDQSRAQMVQNMAQVAQAQEAEGELPENVTSIGQGQG